MTSTKCNLAAGILCSLEPKFAVALRGLVVISCLIFSACQTMPASNVTPNPVISASTSTTIKGTDANVYVDNHYSNDTADYDYSSNNSNDDYPIEPYTPSKQYDESSDLPATYTSDESVENPIPKVVIEDYTLSEPIPAYDEHSVNQAPVIPSRDELLQRARQNSQQQTNQTSSNNSNLPAFKNLMQIGTNQLQAGKLTAAENSFTSAQRLAPKSSAVYFYLSQVALKKNQPRKAEAMARRGLNVSQDSRRRQALWQLILKSGQAQNNSRVIREAQQALR